MLVTSCYRIRIPPVITQATRLATGTVILVAPLVELLVVVVIVVVVSVFMLDVVSASDGGQVLSGSGTHELPTAIT